MIQIPDITTLMINKRLTERLSLSLQLNVDELCDGTS